MRSPVQSALIACLLFLAPAAGQEPEAVATFPLENVERGVRGYGLSVFAGTEPEEFEVEVIGLVKNVHPDTSFILARLTGHGLERSGVIGGMSGSPVYLDEQLAGAVAYSWAFTHEAVAMITPIAAMRDLGSLPRGTVGGTPPSITLEQLATGQLPHDLLARQLATLMPRGVGGVGPQLQFSSVGFGAATRATLEQALGAVVPAGSRPELDTELKAGSAVAAVLIGGDLEFAATGTVTERRGDDVVAFGHPYLGLGAIQIPMAPVEIVTVISSQASSFKVSNIGPVIGAFEEDRMAGIYGRVGSHAPTIPMEIRVLGGPESHYSLELAKMMTTPTLSAIAVLEAMDASRGQSADQDLELRAKLSLAGHEPVELARHFSGSSASISSALYLLSMVSFVLNNGTEEVEIEGIEIDLIQAPRPRTVSLTGAHAARRNVRPGEDVKIHLDLRQYRGETLRDSITVTLPTDLRRGPYYIFLGDAAAIDAARLRMQPQEPRNFSDSLEILRAFHTPDELVVLGVAPSRGLVVDGKTLPSLPGSIRSIWKAAGPLAAKAANLAIRDEQAHALPYPLAGATRIDLNILPSLD